MAAPVANGERKCGEASGEWSSSTCSKDYGHISSMAAKCCSDGASYCPASQLPPPQLCADSALYSHQECVGYITSNFTEEMCRSQACCVRGTPTPKPGMHLFCPLSCFAHLISFFPRLLAPNTHCLEFSLSSVGGQSVGIFAIPLRQALALPWTRQ